MKFKLKMGVMGMISFLTLTIVLLNDGAQKRRKRYCNEKSVYTMTSDKNGKPRVTMSKKGYVPTNMYDVAARSWVTVHAMFISDLFVTIICCDENIERSLYIECLRIASSVLIELVAMPHVEIVIGSLVGHAAGPLFQVLCEKSYGSTWYQECWNSQRGYEGSLMARGRVPSRDDVERLDNEAYDLSAIWHLFKLAEVVMSLSGSYVGINYASK